MSSPFPPAHSSVVDQVIHAGLLLGSAILILNVALVGLIVFLEIRHSVRKSRWDRQGYCTYKPLPQSTVASLCLVYRMKSEDSA
jgi:hypothetical protein